MLIGINGEKGSGKSAAGNHLVVAHDFKPVAFADLVKHVAKDLFPSLTHAQCWGSLEDKERVDPAIGKAPRWIFQRVGTEVGREGDMGAFAQMGVPALSVRAALKFWGVTPGPTAWIDATLNGLGALDEEDNYVITDVRFPNEAEAVRARGGKVIRIERPDFATGELEDHPSETQVKHCVYDVLVVNDKHLGHLYDQVSGAYASFRKNA